MSTRVRAKSPLDLQISALVGEHGEVQHLVDSVAFIRLQGIQMLGDYI